MDSKVFKDKTFLLLAAGIMGVFIGRTLLAVNMAVPRLFDLFDTLVVLGALVVCLTGWRCLRWGDWAAALLLAAVAGVGMGFARFYTPYPFFGVLDANTAQGVIRGSYTLVALLGGLVIMRQGGPVPFYLADWSWAKMGRGVLLGLGVGLPLAVVNVFALQATMGQPIAWQISPAALLDALQPGIVEEVIYRFALWGLFWLVLRGALGERAVWLAGVLATLVHAFAHYTDLFLEAPLAALGMGLVLTLVWGLPPLLLVRKRGLASGIAFHWIQDAARFLAGF